MSEGKTSEYVVDLSTVAADQQRPLLVFVSRTAEHAERYQDMTRFMRQLVDWVAEQGKDLDTEERNLLSVAYKNVIGARRASWRTLTGLPDKPFKEIRDAYIKQVESELEDICKDVLDLLENTLISNAEKVGAQDEATVFYLKMAGDYYRYRAESMTDKNHEKSSSDYYGKAFKLAEANLDPTHPIRLGLALNYSVCFYEILKDKKKACELAKNAFDSAISKLDKLEEADYKDSTLIMQLLRDNLTLWTSSGEENE